ncbi:caspase domain-containing protein [Trametes maxima]|nr:caspase domain-containing protein [Trametes maxima]
MSSSRQRHHALSTIHDCALPSRHWQACSDRETAEAKQFHHTPISGVHSQEDNPASACGRPREAPLYLWATGTSHVPSKPMRRRALLVGVKTTNRDHPKSGSESPEKFAPVQGAHRDTKHMQGLLINTFKYNREDILILIDDPNLLPDQRESHWPTKDNIVREMKTLVQNAANGDHIVFLYSGHGGQVKAVSDRNEVDGLDEILLPADAYCVRERDGPHRFENYIMDDLIRETFEKLPAECKCVMFFDCCNSGTAADLNDVTSGYSKMQTIYRVSKESESSRTIKTSGKSVPPPPPTIPDLTSWSACKDGHMTTGNSKGGVFTRAFCRVLRTAAENDWTLTHEDMLHELSDEIKRIMSRIDSDRKPDDSHIPTPQLGSLRPEDILKEPFTL